MRDGARSRNYDGFFGNDERLGLRGSVDRVANQIVNRNGAIKNRAGSQNRPPLHDRSFINAGIPAHQNFVFDNYRQRTDRFKYAADLRSRGNVSVAAHLFATPTV